MGVSQDLATYLVSGRVEDIPEDVVHEARRALLNYVGCALGGARHEAMEIALRVFAPLSGAPAAGVLGRSERLDVLHAALMNGISSHVHDFDDTTPKNYIHPTSPVASALFSYASANRVSGRDFLNAFVLGFEAESRVGNAVYPAHYDVGWHITGTAGVFGAAAAIGKLRGLDGQKMVWSLGLAATQAAGLREMFGAMGKAFHPGRAAQNGYAAALLAEEGFTGGNEPIEGPRGFAAVQAASYNLSKVTQDFGREYNLRDNTYKPFPCGIVNHPTIDACIQIHKESGLRPDEIAAVRLRVAPLVLDLCNKQDIHLGLEGKFSVYHGAAVGLTRGKAGLGEYSDEAVNDPLVKVVRETVTATADPAITEDGVVVEVETKDGRRIAKTLEHSLGNLARPMSDSDLETKLRDQAEDLLPPEQVEKVIALCWKIDGLDEVGQLVEACRAPA